MAPAKGRTQQCNRAQARVRLDQARGFVETAELVSAEESDLALEHVSAALAVLAGIAAADAACCATLGERSRGQDHRQALALVSRAGPDGRSLARALGQLLNIKDNAHYGLVFVNPQVAKRAIRYATTLVNRAAQLILE